MKRFFSKYAIRVFLLSVILTPAASYALDLDFYGSNANSYEYGPGLFNANSPIVIPASSGNNVSGRPLSLGTSGGTINTFQELVAAIVEIINYYLVPLLFTLALFWFLYGVVEYIRSVGDQKKREDGRWMMVYGIIGLTVMVSVWALVNIVRYTFNFDYRQPPIPEFKSSLSTPLGRRV